MRRITLATVRKFEPCYDPAIYGLKSATLAEILSIKDCPDADKVWVACHILSREKRVIFANWCASRAKKFGYYDAGSAYAAAYAAADADAAAYAAAYAAAAAAADDARSKEQKLQIRKIRSLIKDA